METAERAFFDAVAPYRAALRLHCYRMLGSSHDGDDAVQETLIHAWRARATLEDEGRLRPWLYRIATNACLDELKKRPRRAMPQDSSSPIDPVWPLSISPEPEAVWIEPMPDTWMAGEAPDPAAQDPSVQYTLKESVTLAFVAALHVLSPAQRATLLLRDVVGLSAEETALALDLNLGAANSALFRARETVEKKLGGREAGDFAESAGEIDQALLARYVRAYEEANIDDLIAMFHRDIVTAMPPFAAWISGSAANAAFYRGMLDATLTSGTRIVLTRANARPALAFYRKDTPEGVLRLRAIHVVGMRDGKIANVDHFMQPLLAGVFGLPAEL